MYGFACSETPQLLPLPVVLAHRLTLTLTNARKLGTIQGLGPDGKAQVSVEYRKGRPERIAAVVVSCQHDVAGTSSISLAPPQAAGLTHCAVPPFPTRQAARGPRETRQTCAAHKIFHRMFPSGVSRRELPFPTENGL